MTEFDDNRIAVQDTEWTRMWQRTNEIWNPANGSFVKREEARCSEETAMVIKQRETSNVLPPFDFGAALGIPLLVSEDVPVGKFQIWRDGELIREIDITE